MRNSDNKLNDIRFPFDPDQDTPELLSSELVEHGLIPKVDEKSICNSITSFLASQQPQCFRVHIQENFQTDPETGAPVDPNENALIGYALLSLDDGGDDEIVE